MTIKLYCQLPIKDEEGGLGFFIEMLKNNFDKIKNPDTEIIIKTLKSGVSDTELFSYSALRFVNDREILLNILEAVNEGYDGVVVTCFLDPSLCPTRQVLDIPVVGIGESAMHLACMMGKKFAVITSDPGYVSDLEENIKKYSMESFIINNHPVRSMPLSGDEFFSCFAGDYSPVINSFREIGRSCIEDGAEVLIAGCGLLSGMLTFNGIDSVDGAPVLDPVMIGFKFGEVFVQLHKAGMPVISRRGMYTKAPGREVVDIIKGD